MAFDFNKRLFTLFGEGNGFQAAANTKSQSTGARALTLKSTLDKYLPSDDDNTATTLPDETKVVNCQAALTAFAASSVNMSDHINARLDTFLDDMQVAATIKEIDAYVDDVPASCATIDSVAGSMGDAGDAVLSEAVTALDTLERGIEDYDTNEITLTEFEQILVNVTIELNASTAAILSMITTEKEAVDGMYKKTRQLANVFAVESLISDPCVGSLIEKFAGEELMRILYKL